MIFLRYARSLRVCCRNWSQSLMELLQRTFSWNCFKREALCYIPDVVCGCSFYHGFVWPVSSAICHWLICQWEKFYIIQVIKEWPGCSLSLAFKSLRYASVQYYQSFYLTNSQVIIYPVQDSYLLHKGFVFYFNITMVTKSFLVLVKCINAKLNQSFLSYCFGNHPHVSNDNLCAVESVFPFIMFL